MVRAAKKRKNTKKPAKINRFIICPLLPGLLAVTLVMGNSQVAGVVGIAALVTGFTHTDADRSRLPSFCVTFTK